MKSRYLAERWWEEKETPLGSANALGQMEDLINLSIGDPDIITPKIVIEGAFKDALAGHTKYTAFEGQKELREEIAKYYKDEFGTTVGLDEIMVTASATNAMYLVLSAILNPFWGEEILFQSPYFTLYTQQISQVGGVPVLVNTYEEDDFQFTRESLEAAISDKTRAIIVNNPTNPTGNCFSRETMEMIVDVATKHDILILADEIYTSYCFQNDFVPFINIPGARERTITINSFSKNFIMTGWRVGSVVAPPYFIEVLKHINENIIFSAPTISQRAALHALRHRNEIAAETVDVIKERVFYAVDRINKIPNMHVLSPARGTFYLFVNIKATGLTSAEVTQKLLEEAHVLVIPGTGFGEAGEGYLRLACTVPIEKLEEAFDRIEKMPIFQ